MKHVARFAFLFVLIQILCSAMPALAQKVAYTLPDMHPGVPSVAHLIRGLFGMAFLILIAWLLSVRRKSIDWKQVGIGLAVQLVLAISVLYIPVVRSFFEMIGRVLVKVLDFSKEGSEFLFGPLATGEGLGYIFCFQALPTILFFSALVSLCYYLGIVQRLVWGMAWLVRKALRVSGVESLTVAANVFLGMSEAPLLVKPYLPKLTASEVFMVMTAGLATIAGGVMALYVSTLGGSDPAQRLIFATHLLSASVMAMPAAIVMAKIIYPQTEPFDLEVEVSRDRIGSNALSAISNGTVDGMKVAANVGAMLIVFVAFIAMADYMLSLVGEIGDINGWVAGVTGGRFQSLSFGFVLGTLFAPLMWLIGVVPQDMMLVGQLQGLKLVLTELVGYTTLAEMKAAGAFLDPRSIIMSTYMLCGFANIASIGILVGSVGTLAPNWKEFIGAQGFRAMLAGNLASLSSATLVGMMF
ncbi:MAG: nucleoside transporter C-terminal domain-containing protein [Bacteroidales bacterium]|nr:nucleoside transporter C-terminal domain-containing protein [Bacteroidales bacterium]